MAMPRLAFGPVSPIQLTSFVLSGDAYCYAFQSGGSICWRVIAWTALIKLSAPHTQSLSNLISCAWAVSDQIDIWMLLNVAGCGAQLLRRKNQAAAFLWDPLGKFASKLLPGSSYTMREVWKCDRHVASDSHRGVQWPQGTNNPKLCVCWKLQIHTFVWLE